MRKLLLILLAVLLLTSCREEPTKRQIISKYECEGKCYIALEQEVTPEDYIGYDIGDEYED